MGYNSTTLVKGKYNLISLPFSSVAGGNSKLVDALSGSGWYSKMDSTDSDTLEVWNPVTTAYTMYYWYEDETHEYDGWYEAIFGTYLFDDCAENADGIECGWTAWYHSRGDSAPVVTFSGAVESADDVQSTIYGGCYNLIANPFPTAFQPNADQPWWSGSATKLVDWNDPISVTDSTDSDTIEFWDPTTANYAIYYYWEDNTHAYDGWYEAIYGTYFFENDPAHPENANGIPAGKVFWYRSRAEKGTSKKITFINPTK